MPTTVKQLRLYLERMKDSDFVRAYEGITSEGSVESVIQFESEPNKCDLGYLDTNTGEFR